MWCFFLYNGAHELGRQEGAPSPNIKIHSWPQRCMFWHQHMSERFCLPPPQPYRAWDCKSTSSQQSEPLKCKTRKILTNGVVCWGRFTFLKHVRLIQSSLMYLYTLAITCLVSGGVQRGLGIGGRGNAFFICFCREGRFGVAKSYFPHTPRDISNHLSTTGQFGQLELRDWHKHKSSHKCEYRHKYTYKYKNEYKHKYKLQVQAQR